MTGETFRKIRKKLDLTQEQLAVRLQVHRVTVSRWESGELVIDERTKLAMEHLKLKFDMLAEVPIHADEDPISQAIKRKLRGRKK